MPIRPGEVRTRVIPAKRMNSLKSFAMICGPLSEMMRVRASGKRGDAVSPRQAVSPFALAQTGLAEEHPFTHEVRRGVSRISRRIT